MTSALRPSNPARPGAAVWAKIARAGERPGVVVRLSNGSVVVLVIEPTGAPAEYAVSTDSVRSWP